MRSYIYLKKRIFEFSQWHKLNSATQNIITNKIKTKFYCNISAILVAIIKLKYLKKKRINVRTLLSTHLSNTLIDYMYAYIHISHSALIGE